MYKLIIESNIGDYLKDKVGTIYKVTGISVNIIFNEETMKEEGRLLYEGVDVGDSSGQLYIISGHLVEKATEEEVDEYMLGNYTFGPQVSSDGKVVTKTKLSLGKPSKNNSAKSKQVKVRTINDVLDEVLHVKGLIKMLGDEDGQYKRRLGKLAEEFNTYSKDA